MPGKSRRKQYVKVIATHNTDGSVEPKIIILEDRSSAFIVGEVKGMTQVRPENTSKLYNRYTIAIKGKETYLYEECGKWFVQMKS